MSEEDSVDLETLDAEKEMLEPLAQEAATKSEFSAQTSAPPAVPEINDSQDSNLDRILDIPLVLSAQLGNTRMLIKDLLKLGPGSMNL
jgi:flagellar motor switch protein FliN/FliY